jgi:hypothetical protein
MFNRLSSWHEGGRGSCSECGEPSREHSAPGGFLSRVWLSEIRTDNELMRGDPARALEFLEPVTPGRLGQFSGGVPQARSLPREAPPAEKLPSFRRSSIFRVAILMPHQPPECSCNAPAVGVNGG